MRNDNVAHYDGYSHLWLTVLYRALEDVAAEPIPKDNKDFKEREYYRQDALEWFVDTSTNVGSMKWICTQLNISEERIHARVRSKCADIEKSNRPISTKGPLAPLGRWEW